MTGSSEPIHSAESDRDGAGRFLRGHGIRSPGNPRLRRLGALQEAVAEAITPAELTTVVQRLRDQALDGDTQAARLLLERCLGRPREEAPEVCIDLPDLVTAADVADATRRIAAAAATGDLDVATAAAMLGIVRSVSEMNLLPELQLRLERIEARQ